MLNVSVSNVAAYLGIHLAANTGYQNRWKAPQSREPWNGTFSATDFGPACHPAARGQRSYSENCLSLNIWTNAVIPNVSLPVLVWNQGTDEASKNTRWYRGGMALKDIVVLTFIAATVHLDILRIQI
jgi:carboxylesterase 2